MALDKETIINTIKDHPSTAVKFAVTDIDGVLRGKIISKDKLIKALDSGIGFCNVIFGWDINDACYDNSEITGWHTGYPDSFAEIDPTTFREIPWDNNKPFLLADFESNKDISQVCPRSLLKRIRYEAHQMGFIPKYSNEFEWFNFNETPQSYAEKGFRDPTPITSGMFGYSILRASLNSEFLGDLFRHLSKFDVPIEGLHTETGNGVYEACIEYDEILSAADKAVLFKSGVKEIAYHYEILASFMAKWNPDLPGSSGHIHQSLWNREENKNLFYDSNSTHKMSDLAKQFLAGQLYCLPYILPMFAPTVNSYKRFVEGSWAPTTVSWGIENRTTAVRLILHDAESARIEHRVPGADANPYLSMAAALASGLYGIKNELELTLSPTKGNEYDNTATKPLHTNLHKATKAMKESEIAKELFGEEFTNHFIRTREWEWKQYDPEQRNWELKRYFEIV